MVDIPEDLKIQLGKRREELIVAFQTVLDQLPIIEELEEEVPNEVQTFLQERLYQLQRSKDLFE